MATIKATSHDYLLMSDTDGGPTQQPPDQPVRLFHPNPGTATATNMVAQHNLLPAVPGARNVRGAKRLSRSRSPSATPPRGRWATNSPPLGRRGAALGPASDPGPGSEADHSAPPTMPKARPKAATNTTNRDWAQELTQTRGRILGMDTRLDTVEQQLLATQKLVKDLDEFAARVREAAQLHEAKLTTMEAHCVQQDARILELQQGLLAMTLGGNQPTNTAEPAGLAAVRERLEQLFQAASEISEKSKAAEAHRVKQDARLQELQQAVYSAAAAGSSAQTGATDSTGPAAVRTRLDELSVNALETGDKLVALQFTVQAMQAESFSEAHRQLAQGMEYFQAEFEKQIAEINVRIAEGTCKCPTSCPGPRTGTCGQAQGPNPTQANKGADPWSQARAGSQGGGGSGGNG